MGIHSVDQGEEEIYSFGCIELLVKILKKKISSQILPGQFPSVEGGGHIFKPI